MREARLAMLFAMIAFPLGFVSWLAGSPWPALLAFVLGVMFAVPVHAFALPRFRRVALALAVFLMPISFLGMAGGSLGIIGTPMYSLWLSPGLGLVMALFFDGIGIEARPAEA